MLSVSRPRPHRSGDIRLTPSPSLREARRQNRATIILRPGASPEWAQLVVNALPSVTTFRLAEDLARRWIRMRSSAEASILENALNNTIADCATDPVNAQQAASPVNPYDKHKAPYSTHLIVAMRKGWNAGSSSQWSQRSRNDYRRISLCVAVRLGDHRRRGNSHVSDLYEQ